MLAAHILLHTLLSLSLPGPSGSHREENVVDMRLRTVLIEKMNIFTQKGNYFKKWKMMKIDFLQ